MCEYGHGEQDAVHLLTQCTYVDVSTREEVVRIVSEDSPNISCNIFLSDWSRNPFFLKLCISAVNSCSSILRKEIILEASSTKNGNEDESRI